MKVALVCDWLTNVGGAEKVLLSLHEMFPDAPIYTSQYNKKGIDWFNDANIITGWMQILPSKARRFLGPLRQIYFNHLDLSDFDIIISVTGAEAKGIKHGSAKHFCFCHVPTQYYWQFFDTYLENPGFGFLNPLARLCLKVLIKPLRKFDFEAAQKPDEFITISSYAQEMIRKYYKRESTVIFPPVAVENFLNKKIKKVNSQIVQQNKSKKSQIKKYNKNRESQEALFHDTVENFTNIRPYITTSRQVTWKRIDLIVKSCKKLKKHLLIIGDGPEHNYLLKIADNSKYIHFLPIMKQEILKEYLKISKAYIFPSLEPFGIAPVEALASGCPVIAYKKGGALDYIVENENGIFFKKQTVDSICEAIERFEQLNLNHQKIISSSIPFDEKNFKKKIQRFIDEKK